MIYPAFTTLFDKLSSRLLSDFLCIALFFLQYTFFPPQYRFNTITGNEACFIKYNCIKLWNVQQVIADNSCTAHNTPSNMFLYQPTLKVSYVWRTNGRVCGQFDRGPLNESTSNHNNRAIISAYPQALV